MQRFSHHGFKRSPRLRHAVLGFRSAPCIAGQRSSQNLGHSHRSPRRLIVRRGIAAASANKNADEKSAGAGTLFLADQLFFQRKRRLT
jgi:hypothetical protein